MTANYHKYVLEFKKPSGTSRGVLLTKETWFIVLENDGKIGIGECGILRGLSVDDRDDYEEKLKWTCDNIHLGVAELWNQLIEFPSIQFGIETAFNASRIATEVCVYAAGLITIPCTLPKASWILSTRQPS